MAYQGLSGIKCCQTERVDTVSFNSLKKKKKEREEKEEKKDTHNIPFCNLCIIKRDTAHVLDYTSYQHFLLDRGQLGQHHNLCKQPVRAILQPHKSKPLEDKVEEGEETFP